MKSVAFTITGGGPGTRYQLASCTVTEVPGEGAGWSLLSGGTVLSDAFAVWDRDLPFSVPWPNQPVLVEGQKYVIFGGFTEYESFFGSITVVQFD